MEDLPFSAQLGILVLEGVQAVGRRDDDLLHALAVVQLDVGLGQLLEELFVADLADGLSAAALLIADDAEADSRGLKALATERAIFWLLTS